MSTGTPSPSTAPTARTLLLLRHAKAEPAGSVADQDRPLALRGRRQAATVGSALAGSTVPDRVLVSSSLRTRQTWDLLHDRLGSDPEVDVLDSLYLASTRDLLAIVAAHGGDAGTLLVVGHEPTMATTAGLLAGPGSDDAALAQVRVGLPTAAWATLGSDLPWDAWDRRTAVLRSVERAEA